VNDVASKVIIMGGFAGINANGTISNSYLTLNGSFEGCPKLDGPYGSMTDKHDESGFLNIGGFVGAMYGGNIINVSITGTGKINAIYILQRNTYGDTFPVYIMGLIVGANRNDWADVGGGTRNAVNTFKVSSAVPCGTINGVLVENSSIEIDTKRGETNGESMGYRNYYNGAPYHTEPIIGIENDYELKFRTANIYFIGTNKDTYKTLSGVNDKAARYTDLTAEGIAYSDIKSFKFDPANAGQALITFNTTGKFIYEAYYKKIGTEVGKTQVASYDNVNGTFFGSTTVNADRSEYTIALKNNVPILVKEDSQTWDNYVVEKYTLTITYGTYGTYTLNPLTKEYDGAVPLTPNTINLENKDIKISNGSAFFDFVVESVGSLEKNIGVYNFVLTKKSKDYIFADAQTKKLYLFDNAKTKITSTITPRNLTISYTGHENLIFNSLSRVITSTIDNVVAGENVILSGVNAGANVTNVAGENLFINAGTYTVTPSIASGNIDTKIENYALDTIAQTLTFNIAKREITTTFDAINQSIMPYNAQAQNINFKIIDVLSGNELSMVTPEASLEISGTTFYYNKDVGGALINESSTAFINAGKHYAFVKLEVNSKVSTSEPLSLVLTNNYTYSAGEFAYEITKINPTKKPALPVSGFSYYVVPDLPRLSYNKDNTLANHDLSFQKEYGSWAWKDALEVPVVAKTEYLGVFTPTDSINFNSIEVNIPLALVKADVVINTDNVQKLFTYTGEQFTINSGATTNNSDAGVVITYANNSFTTASALNVEGAPYKVTISTQETENYNASSVIVDVVVNKGNLVLTASTVDHLFVNQSFAKVNDGWTAMFNSVATAGSEPVITWKTGTAPIIAGSFVCLITFTPTNQNINVAVVEQNINVSFINVELRLAKADSAYRVFNNVKFGDTINFGTQITDIPTELKKNSTPQYDYIFNNKWLDVFIANKEVSFTNIQDNITAYAVFDGVERSYFAVFNTDGGSEILSQNILYNHGVLKVPAPTKTGYFFAGFYYTNINDVNTLFEFSSVDEIGKRGTIISIDTTIKANDPNPNNIGVTLNAKWVKNTIDDKSIVYDSTKNLSTIPLVTENYTWLDSTIIPSVPVKTYTAVFTPDDMTFYAEQKQNVSVNIVVSKAIATITNNLTSVDKTFTYNGEFQSIDTTKFSHNNTDAAAALNFVANSFKNCETKHAITVNLPATDNYLEATQIIEVVINKAIITFSSIVPVEILMGQQDQLNSLITYDATFKNIKVDGVLSAVFEIAPITDDTSKGQIQNLNVLISFKATNENFEVYNETKSLTLRWLKVTYNFNGGLIAGENSYIDYVAYNGNLTLSDIKPTKVHETPDAFAYQFGGYSLSTTTINLITALSSITSDQEIFAIYTVIDKSVNKLLTFTIRSGEQYTIWVPVNTVLTGKDLPAMPVGTEVFEGWYNGLSLYDLSQPIVSDMTLTAKWTAVVLPVINPIIYNRNSTLSSVNLNDIKWSWKDGNIVPTALINSYVAKYSRECSYYPDAEFDIALIINKAAAEFDTSAMIKEYNYTGELITINSGAKVYDDFGNLINLEITDYTNNSYIVSGKHTVTVSYAGSANYSA
ncbi:MAG: hypothetical protein RR334_03315, partial [Clostridia bacterium]